MKLTGRTLGIGRKQLYAEKGQHGKIWFNRDDVINVMERFYRKLYSNNDRQTEDPNMEAMNIEVPCINMSEIKETLKGMSSGITGDADGLLIDLIKDTHDFLLDKFAVFVTKMLAKLYCTKYLEKHYDNTISQKRRPPKPKKLSSNEMIIRSFTGITCNRQITNKDEWRKLREAFVLQWTQ